MIISLEFEGRNARRFSKPWIAKVIEWKPGEQPVLKFGSFVGDIESGGTVEIEAEPGDVIRYGQKDYRGNRGNSEWCIVNDRGELVDENGLRVTTATEARKHYRQRQEAAECESN